MGNRLHKPSNKLMVDQLMDSPYPLIKSASVESAFRAVDRANYLSEKLEDPYDLTEIWRKGNLHLSAPNVYAKVVDSLLLEPGLSFLNLGSGTGYLNTIVGLLIGPSGVNHGVEFHGDVVEYAYKKLEEFKGNSCAIYKYDFSEPIFIQGNCLMINSDRKYDRIYLGAACLPEMESFMKKLLSLDGGILVMPYQDQLTRYTRTGENTWTKEEMMGVNFTMMIGPNNSRTNHCNSNENSEKIFEMPLTTPKSLMELCRISIKQQLRHKTNLMKPNLLNSDNIDRRKQRRAMASLAVHRVEEQRQADAIRKQRAAAAAAAAAAAHHYSWGSLSTRVNRSCDPQSNQRDSRQCCRGLRGRHPIKSAAAASTDLCSLRPTTDNSVQQRRAITSGSATQRATTSKLADTIITHQALHSMHLTGDCQNKSDHRQAESRMLTRSASRKLQTGLPETDDYINNYSAFGDNLSGCNQNATSRINLGRNNDTLYKPKSGQYFSSNQFRANKRNALREDNRQTDPHRCNHGKLVNNRDRALPLISQDEQRNFLVPSPLFVIGGGSVTGHIVPANRESSILPRRRLDGPLLEGVHHRTAAELSYPPTSISYSLVGNSNYARNNTLYGPSRGIRSPDMGYQVSEPPWHYASEDESNEASLYPEPLMRRKEISPDGDDDIVSTSSAELSWSSASSHCVLESSQESDSEQRSRIANEEQVDHIDDDDDDELSSLGESWDSFLIDANGDNADTSDDDDDGDNYDEHRDEMLPSRFNASIEFDIESSDDPRYQLVDDGQSTEEQDRPVSSRLRSSTITQVGRSNSQGSRELVSTGNDFKQMHESRPRTSVTVSQFAACTSCSLATNSSAPSSSSGNRVRPHCAKVVSNRCRSSNAVVPQLRRKLHICRRHRVLQERTNGARLASIGIKATLSSRNSSRGSGSDKIGVGRLNRRNHCSHARNRKQFHNCWWHRRRQLHDHSACLPHNRHFMHHRDSSVDTTPEQTSSHRPENSSDVHLMLNSLGDAYAASSRRKITGVSVANKRGRRFSPHTSTTLSVKSSGSTSTSAKRKRQTSSSSSSSSSESSLSLVSNSEPAHLLHNKPSNSARKQPATRRLRMANFLPASQCLCSRNKNSLVATTSSQDPQLLQHRLILKRSLRLGAARRARALSRSGPIGLDYYPHAANDADEEDSVECEWERLEDEGSRRRLGRRNYCRRHSYLHSCSRYHHHRHCQSNIIRPCGHLQNEQQVNAQRSAIRGDRSREIETRRRVERRERRNLRRAPSSALAVVPANSKLANGVTSKSALQSLEVRKKKPRENECEKYRTLISGFIRDLPLPKELRDFLNHDREF